MLQEIASAGVRRLGVTTGGAAICSEENAAGAIGAGVRSIEVILLGGDPYTHDTLTGAPGSFDTSLAGIARFKNAAQQAGVRVVVRGRSRICRHNQDDVPQIVCTLAEAGASVVTLDIDRAVSRGRLRPLLEAAIETGIVYGVWVVVEGLSEAELREYAVNRLAPAVVVPLEEWRPDGP